MANVNNIANEIAKQLAIYTEDVKEKVVQATDTVTKNAVKDLRGLNHPKLTGDYAKGWSRKKTEKGFVIHNRTDYQLTHLLEHGHAKRGGGRVSAIPHIRPIEEQTVEEFERLIEEAIRG